jgi:hypothetical protein
MATTALERYREQLPDRWEKDKV